jgi:N-glycosylase/DNA lyase
MKNSFRFHIRHDPHWAVMSHGWPLLAPLSVSGTELFWVARGPDTGVHLVAAAWSRSSTRVNVKVDGVAITERDKEHLLASLRRMFRADERFDQFWRGCAGHKVLSKCPRDRLGALLRSATLFEDVIKTMCTVNCHWRNTKSMLSTLCQRFGERHPEHGSLSTFPTPDDLARASIEDLRKSGLGYRAENVRAFAKAVARGGISLAKWPTCDRDTVEKELLAIRGVGPYAAAHVLMLLGHYSAVPCDSEVCAYLGLPSRTKPREVQQAIAKRYGAWGEHAFLAYKFERVLTHSNYVDC